MPASARGLLITGAAEVATLAGGPRRGTAQGDAAIRRNVSISVVGEAVHAVGSEPEVLRALESDGIDPSTLEQVDASGCLVTPGLIDPHTHLLFGGTRERELRQRQEGATYLEILASGGGILSTVDATRAASDDALRAHGERWLAEMLGHGVTTIEAKSGYGLDTQTELRLLSVADELGRTGPIEIVPTFLGAHAVPREMRGQPDAVDAYVRDVIERQVPAVARQGLARFCDVFCELGVFDAGQSRTILDAGIAHGLRPRLHADELHDSGGAALAAEIGAASADHLGAISEAGIAGLARAADQGHPVVATLLPTTALYLRSEHHVPARDLIDRGVPVAIGTDFNPGTSPTPNLGLVLSLATITLGLTAAEALAAVTVNAALAIGLERSHGSLEPGHRADLCIWEVPSLEQLPYWIGANLCRTVIKAGRRVSGA